MRPTLPGLSGNVRIVLRHVKEKVVENDLVEVPRGQFRNILYICALFRIGVRESLELPRVLRGMGDSASDLHAAIEKELLNAFDQLLIDDAAAPIGLDINLINS